MNLRFKHLGMIESADISLQKPLTVFCGPNGTGKTYISYIVYALLRNFTQVGAPLATPEMSKLVTDGKIEISLDKGLAASYRKSLVAQVKKNMHEIFGISKDEASRQFNEFELSFNISIDDFWSRIIKSHFTSKIFFGKTTITLNKSSNKNFVSVKYDRRQASNPYDLIQISIMLVSMIYRRLLLDKICNTHILPVERNSVFTFSKELSLTRGAVVEKILNHSDASGKSLSELIDKNANRYPLAIRDCLKVAGDLKEIQKKSSKYAYLADEIEQDVLRGHISADDDGNLKLACLNMNDKQIELPIHMTASVVKTISSLVLHLRHLAKDNDLLIIDEPEMNLHPSAQVMLARIFGKIINAGLRLLISTHSDYLVRELNNLIMLSSASANDSDLQKLGYRKSQLIAQDDVDVYLFKPSADYKNIDIKNVKVNQDGFEVETIDHTIDKLNRVSDLAYSLLEKNNTHD